MTQTQTTSRQAAPPSGPAPLQLQAPPQTARPVPQPMVVRAMPLVMLLAAGGMVAVMLSSGIARNPLTLMFPAMMALSTVAMLVGTWQGGNRRLEMAEKRRDYLRYLDLTRAELRQEAGRQHHRLVARHPEPGDLTMCALRGDTPPRGEDIEIRLGVGVVPLERPVVTPDLGPVDELEPVCVAALRRLVHTHCSVREAPVAVDVASFPVVSVYGEVARVRELVRAAMAQLAVHHGPERVRIAAACGNREARQAWDLLKWLPQHADRVYADGAGAVRLTESSLWRLELLLGGPPEESGPHLVVVADGDPGPARDWLDPADLPRACTIVEVCSSPSGPVRTAALRSGLALDLVAGPDGERLCTAAEQGAQDLLTPDRLDAAATRDLFQQLARDADGSGGPRPGRSGTRRARLDFLAELGHGPAGALRTTPPGGCTPEQLWSPRTGAERLRVPIGLDDDGTPIQLDLKESAHGGHGPHGLCIGATGSGKSEFLRTLVLALVATHAPEQLNLVLVDFKGGATFRGLEGLHHVAASITNLADEESLVDRMRDALEGELVRRQEMLRAAGCANVAEYQRRRDAATGSEEALPPLPALFVVVDEFSELLSARPEFIDLFVQIGRLGRSLQIHLLLASQRLEEGRLRGLESHLSYRIALKTFSAAESRTVLGTTDAYTLPGRPGAGYLKVDSAGPRRFDAAYVSGPLEGGHHAAAGGLEFVAVPPRVREFGAGYLPVEPPAETAPAAPDRSASVLPPGISAWDLCTAQLAGLGPRAHEIWLQPLPGHLPLSAFGDTGLVAAAAADTPETETGGRLPWAVVDLPFEQRRDLLAPDLESPDSAALVVGAPRSGKSTALLSLALSAALRHRPDRLHVYAIDYGGGALAELVDLPHTAGVAGRGDTATARRILSELAARVRRHERPGHEPDGTHALLLVDGWQAARAELEDLDAAVGALAAEGLGAGVHVVVTAARAMDVRPVVRDALSTRLELRLVDPADSMLGRRAARVISPGTPGRGVVESGHLVQMLAPDVIQPDGATAGGAAPAVGEQVAAIAAAWQQAAPGVQAPRVRLLPEVLPFAEIAALARRHTRPAQAWNELRIPVGIEETELAPAYLDLAAEPLTLVFGNAGSGKTSLLRGLARATVAMAPACDVRVLLVDPRRRLRDLVPQDHLAGIAATEDELGPMIGHLAEVLRTRLADLADPDAEVTGPRIVVLVDDLDLLVGTAGNPLAPLVPLLAHAGEIGLTLVLTRRVSGAARAAFDPVVQRMRDLGAAGLVLDGTKDEGRLVGDLVARPLPPGRAQYHSRETGTRLWQLALVEP